MTSYYDIINMYFNHEHYTSPPSPPPPEGYFSIAPVHGQRQQRPLNIILSLLFATSSQILGPTRLKKKKGKKEKKQAMVGHSFANYVFTPLQFVVSGVVYSGIEL